MSGLLKPLVDNRFMEPSPGSANEMLMEALGAIEELDLRRQSSILTHWPTIYPSQKSAVQSFAPITALFGANQSGKTVTGLRRMAWDLTGIYPDWYEGPRTETAINAWIVGESSDLTRDGLQKKLLGPDVRKPGKDGILAACYLIGKPEYRQNSGGAIDYFKVKHISGGTSVCGFKNYSQGRENLQSATLDRLLVDEEAPPDAWDELLMRVSEAQQKGSGFVMVCFTPLKGKTRVVTTLMDDNPDVAAFFLSAEEASHLGQAHMDKWRRLLRHDPAMLKARLYGLPDISSGLIWPVRWDDYKIPRFECEKHWPRIGAIDYGWTHPTVLLVAAIDPQTDTIFIERALRFEKTQAWKIAQAMMPFISKGIQFFGDPSAEQPDKSSGKALIHTYLDELQPGWQNVPPEERVIVNAPRTPQVRIEMVQKRLDQGTLFLFDDLDPVLFSELQNYSYDKKGRLPEKDDDYPDDLGYLVQCARKARPMSDFRRSWIAEVKPIETCMRGY